MSVNQVNTIVYGAVSRSLRRSHGQQNGDRHHTQKHRQVLSCFLTARLQQDTAEPLTTRCLRCRL